MNNNDVKVNMTSGIELITPHEADPLEYITPGILLKEEFLDEMAITPYQLAKAIQCTQSQISNIITKGGSISAEMALRFGKFFGNSAQFWLNAQNKFDLYKAEMTLKEKKIVIAQWKVK